MRTISRGEANSGTKGVCSCETVADCESKRLSACTDCAGFCGGFSAGIHDSFKVMIAGLQGVGHSRWRRGSCALRQPLQRFVRRNALQNASVILSTAATPPFWRKLYLSPFLGAEGVEGCC